MRRASHRRYVQQIAAATLCAAVVVAACTSDGEVPVATVPSTTTEPPQPRVDDSVLRIGALIPGGSPLIADSIRTAFEDAVSEVNDAGGVLGNDVEMLLEDEGASATTSSEATEALIERGADAIVGPGSSNTAIAALDAAVAAGVLMCSATATAISLDEFPDGDLFFRSIATDSLQAVAIALQAENRGADRVVIIHVDDAYGQPYANAVADELAASPSIQVSSVAVPFADDDLQDDLDEIAATRADTGIVLGNGADIARLLQAISDRDDIDFNQVIVNDAARTLANQAVISDLDPQLRSNIVGLAPQIVLPDSAEGDIDSPFASQVTDCVKLIALAAAQGGSDAPETIASQMASVSSGGEECLTFSACIELLDADEQIQIDYDPPARITELDREGDPSRAFFDRFIFLADGSTDNQNRLAVS